MFSVTCIVGETNGKGKSSPHLNSVGEEGCLCQKIIQRVSLFVTILLRERQTVPKQGDFKTRSGQEATVSVPAQFMRHNLERPCFENHTENIPFREVGYNLIGSRSAMKSKVTLTWRRV